MGRTKGRCDAAGAESKNPIDRQINPSSTPSVPICTLLVSLRTVAVWRSTSRVMVPPCDLTKICMAFGVLVGEPEVLTPLDQG